VNTTNLALDDADAVTAPDDDAEFVRLTEPMRRELLAHCYRMLGSMHDAEDMVQETYLRAWRSYRGFEGRSSLRAWIYRIATNVCLTSLQHRSRRVLPSGLGAPGDDAPQSEHVSWLQPFPDAQADPRSDDPATIVAGQESLRLALVASWQLLPSRQRAVLLLRDVLAFPAAEVAEMLDTTTAAVKNALHRARTRLEQAAPAADQMAEPTGRQARALLDGYIAAFENSDPAELKRLLKRDATLELLPSPAWFAGGDALSGAVAGLGSPGDWRMMPTSANGQPAVAAYLRDAEGEHRAYGIVVLTVTPTAIARITVFGDPGLLAGFGFPPVL
jgi:RNA polymerase sigma-70 factor, ECF subfamily